MKLRMITENDYATNLIKMNQSHAYEDQHLQQRQAQFSNYYQQLPQFAKELIDAYHYICKPYGMNPGEVSVYLVGGRTVGKPLRADSDLDFIFVPQNHSLHNAMGYTDELQDDQIIRVKSLNKKSWELAKKHGILPNDVHILGSQKQPPANGLLLATG